MQASTTDVLKKAAMMVRTLMLIVMILVTGGAVALAESKTVEGYRVMAYDGRTHQYTIHFNRTFDGKCLVKKIVVVCTSYKWGNHPPNSGETACGLPVGSLYPLHRPREQKGGFVMVTEQNDFFAIVEGIGPDQVVQSFKVVSIEVLPDNGCR
jgi:hypothetical protein